MINIVLYRPEKPSNVGNIMRTALATDAKLIIVGPLTFNFDNKELKRAGMDYIDELNYEYIDNINTFYKRYGDKNIYYVTRYSKNIYSKNDYSNVVEDIYFVFGRESSGIPHKILKDNFEKTIRIPMVASARSLNLSNSVAIIVYEVLRQQKYFSLATQEEIKGDNFLFKDTKND